MQNSRFLTLKILSLAALLLAAGCISNTNNTTTTDAMLQASRNTQMAQANQLGQPVQLGRGGVPAVAEPSLPKVITKTALAGQTIELISIHNLNPDCTPGTLGTIRIVQQPSHGTAQVVARSGYPNFPASNPRSKCNGTQTPGLAVDYTPATGFIGSDLMSAEAFFHNGNETNEVKFIITVK